MMLTMLWKEYREHRVIWLAMAVVNSGVLFGLSMLDETSGFGLRDSKLMNLGAASVLLVWGYGMVCGAMLLAGEREGATLNFLDALPVTRLRLWLAKGQIGLFLLAGQVVLLCGWLMGLRTTVDSPLSLLPYVLGMLVFGLVGMAYGLFFSARSEYVLNAIGWAIVGQVLVGILAQILAFFAAIAWLLVASQIGARNRGPLSGATWGGLIGLMFCGLTLTAIVGSARIFSRPDRLRKSEANQAGRPRKESVWASWGRLIWLSYTQMRRSIVGLSIFALVLGLVMPVTGPVGWPVFTLLIGLICGVTVCGDEQAHGSFRFLGDQRFPLGRVWTVKVSMRFALAVFAAILVVLPSLILMIFHRMGSHTMQEQHVPFFRDVLHSSLVGPIVPALPHLTMWLLYGFSVGQLSGLLVRKSLVAAVVALGGSVTLVCLWLPSLVGVGLHFWQIAGVPLILMATSWFLVPAWAADRLLARGTFARVGAAFAAVGLWSVGALWYCVVEIPDVPDRLDMPAFVASLPTVEENEAGSTIRGAWSQVEKVTHDLGNKRSAKPMFPALRPNEPDLTFYSQALLASKLGWPVGRTDLGDWLDAAFQEKWFPQLAEAADLPLGVVEDPRRLTINSAITKWFSAPPLCQMLAVRGLQLQARGDPRAFVENLRIGLALSRNLQHRSPPLVARNGRQAEAVWLPALDRWLEKLRGHPELLKRVLAILAQHEAESLEEADSVKAAYLIAKNTLAEVPDQLVGMNIVFRPNEDTELRQSEINFAALLWGFSWERERHERIVRIVFEGNPQQRQKAHEWGGFALGSVHAGFRDFVQPRRNRAIADWRASQLKVALRYYQAETGKPAATLDALVPRYLPAIPLDPFDGQPFRYRLSRGERIGWPRPEDVQPPGGPPVAQAGGMGAGGGPIPGMPGMGMMGEVAGMGALPPPALPPPTRFVPKGQGILWSIGEDGRDDGGVQQGLNDFGKQFGQDIIYLVPQPPK